MDKTKTRQQTCTHSIPDIRFENETPKCLYICSQPEKDSYVTEEQCLACPCYKSRYIQYPIRVSEIKNISDIPDKYADDIGKLCFIRITENDTVHLGIFLGELPIGIHTSWDEKTEKLENILINNPAAFVPALNRIFYGTESWWKILTAEDIPQIFLTYPQLKQELLNLKSTFDVPKK